MLIPATGTSTETGDFAVVGAWLTGGLVIGALVTGGVAFVVGETILTVSFA